MDKSQAASRMVEAALPLAAFEGWNQKTLQQAAEAAGYRKTDAIRVFPGGGVDAVLHWARMADAQMLADAKHYHLADMRIRDRIALLVRLRIEALLPHREAARRGLALLALPFHAHHGLAALARTADAMWHAAGDTATDFNYYSKRLLLAGVYTSTLRHWLADQSPGFESSWAFLARRIDDVMQIEKAKRQIKDWMNKKAG